MDESRPLAADTTAHLQSCPECAAFAADWSGAGSLATALAPQPPPSVEFIDRTVQAVLAANEAATTRRAPQWSDFLPRVAAVLALAALGWWLLDPKTVPPSRPVEADSTSPAETVHRQVARLEEPLRREQAALQHATGRGLAQVREIFDRSAVALP